MWGASVSILSYESLSVNDCSFYDFPNMLSIRFKSPNKTRFFKNAKFPPPKTSFTLLSSHSQPSNARRFGSRFEQSNNKTEELFVYEISFTIDFILSSSILLSAPGWRLQHHQIQKQIWRTQQDRKISYMLRPTSESLSHPSTYFALHLFHSLSKSGMSRVGIILE